MKRKFFFGIIFMSVFVISRVFGADEAVTNASKPLTVEEFIGDTDVYLAPTMFPEFKNGTTKDNTSCLSYLKGTVSGKKRSDLVSGGKLSTGVSSNKNCKYYSSFDDATGKYDKKSAGCGKIECGKEDYSVLELNSDNMHSIDMPKGYRNITKVLFTWTVRIEGYAPTDYKRFNGDKTRGIAIWPLLCHPWHGSIRQEFNGGQVSTQLYMKGTSSVVAKNADTDGWAQLEPTADMTIPPVDGVTVYEPSDPTITGSRVVTKDDFELDAKGKNRLPETITFKLMWKNETSLVVKSPAEQRNVVVTLMPVTNAREE